MSTAFRVGIFIVLALVALSAGVFLIGSNDFLFNSTYRLKAEFPNVDGLNPGADVRVGGMHEGTVKEIELPSQPGGKITVLMSLRSSTHNDIKKDSVASIKTQGLLGDEYIEISFGSPKAEEVKNGDMIASETPKDLSQQASAAAVDAQEGAVAFRDDMEALQHNFLLRGFFEKRGYTDASQLTEHAIARLPPGPPVQEFDYDARRIFDKPDDAKLKDKKILDKAGRYLAENRFGLAVVVSSEAKGDTEKDRVLSEARAKVVRDYLTENFKLDDMRLKTFGRGKAKDTSEPSNLAILVYAPSSAARERQSASSSSR